MTLSKKSLPERKRDFLDAYRTTLSTKAASKKSRVTWGSVYTWIHRDKDFKREYNEIKNSTIDRLENITIEHASEDGHLAMRVLARQRPGNWGNLSEQRIAAADKDEKRILKKIPITIPTIPEAYKELIKGARRGLDVSTLAAYASVSAQELRDYLKKGLENKNSEEAKLAYAVVKANAEYVYALKDKLTSDALHKDKDITKDEFKSLLSVKGIIKDILGEE